MGVGRAPLLYVAGGEEAPFSPRLQKESTREVFEPSLHQCGPVSSGGGIVYRMSTRDSPFWYSSPIGADARSLAHLATPIRFDGGIILGRFALRLGFASSRPTPSAARVFSLSEFRPFFCFFGEFLSKEIMRYWHYLCG